MPVDVIHVGLPKCASNLLQRDLLVRHDDINCLTPKFEPALKPVVDAFLAMNSLGASGHFRQTVDDYFNAHAGGLRVLSQEGFAGDMITGQGSSAIASLLRENFGEARIIIVLREQLDYVLSAWRHQVRRGNVYSLSRFIRRFGDEKLAGHTTMPGATLFTRLDYATLVEDYTALFGTSNVLVLWFDDLNRDPSAFVNRLYTFLQVEPLALPEMPVYNSGIQHPGLQSMLNFFSRSSHNEGRLRVLPEGVVSRLARIPLPIQDPQSQKLRLRHLLGKDHLDEIAASNRRLETMTGETLGERGWL